MQAYAPICAEYGQPRSQYTPVGVNTGDGHKMGMWVGAQLQDLPLPTMMHPQAFCWFHGPVLVRQRQRRALHVRGHLGAGQVAGHQPPAERRGVVHLRRNWKTDLVNGLPYGGGMFWDSFRPYGSDLELAPQYFETQIPEYIKAGNAYQPTRSMSWRSRSAATLPRSRPRWSATTACARRARTPITAIVATEGVILDGLYLILFPLFKKVNLNFLQYDSDGIVYQVT